MTEPTLFSLDDLRRAAADGVIDADAVARLAAWRPAARSIEQRKGLNAISVAYYLGALLMISACAWFLGDKWQTLGTAGILATTAIYAAIATALGITLRRIGYLVAGGLLITVAVSLTPLLVYCIEELLGMWPSANPGAYKNYYPYVNGSWLVMEVATMAVAAIALYFVRFGFLAAPFAFSAWFLSMDLWGLLRERAELTWHDRSTISILVGVAILAVGGIYDRLNTPRDRTRSEDLAFWFYLFGLFAFWGGMTSMETTSEFARLMYCVINLALIAVAIVLKRATFLVFGAIGVYLYLGHLAYEMFKDSMLFPFSLALLGLSLILGAVAVQRKGWLRDTRTAPV